jgi:hypothetical protein
MKSMVAAIKSRQNFKKEKTEEQIRRLKICASCPLNSDNKKDLTVKEKIMLIMNKLLDLLFGITVNETAICIRCVCNLYHKSTQTEEDLRCPQKKW